MKEALLEGLSSLRLSECYGSAENALKYLRDPYKSIWGGKVVYHFWAEAMDEPIKTRRKEMERRMRIIRELEDFS